MGGAGGVACARRMVRSCEELWIHANHIADQITSVTSADRSNVDLESCGSTPWSSSSVPILTCVPFTYQSSWPWRSSGFANVKAVYAPKPSATTAYNLRHRSYLSAASASKVRDAFNPASPTQTPAADTTRPSKACAGGTFSVPSSVGAVRSKTAFRHWRVEYNARSEDSIRTRAAAWNRGSSEPPTYDSWVGSAHAEAPSAERSKGLRVATGSGATGVSLRVATCTVWPPSLCALSRSAASNCRPPAMRRCRGGGSSNSLSTRACSCATVPLAGSRTVFAFPDFASKRRISSMSSESSKAGSSSSLAAPTAL
mmetsp:Transcript_4289/g.13448  ORF Transcript_4289/g.13448 Transcript_4289/m.13448 type:complete len:313 (-) Transcript_4289:107-1045(-)